MCLSVVNSTAKPLVGYKCLDPDQSWDNIKKQYVDSNKVNAPCRYGIYTIGEWNMASDIDKIGASDGKKYYVGFHIFKRKEDAKNSRYGNHVYKVEYLGEVTRGKEDGRVVVTALAMRVVEKVNFTQKPRKKVKK